MSDPITTPSKPNYPTQPSQKQLLQSQQQTLAKTRYNKILNATADQSFMPQMSQTQKQILSHGIISQVVERSKKKTVQHDVNRVSNNMRLYTMPQQREENQFDFDTIPPRNRDFVSTASEKAAQINRRLSQSKKLADRLTDIAEKNKQKRAKVRRAAAISADNINKRVSVSGLVTYNFSSVKARRQIGTIPDEPEQVKIARKVEEARRRSTNSLDRQARIVKRKPNVDNLYRAEIGNAAVCDFHTPTDKFLKIMRHQSLKDKKIYGQKMQKLSCIKQYMQKEKTDYQHAKFIVQSIINAQKRPEKVTTSRKSYQTDDDEQLARRRQVLNKKKITLRHLCFTQL